MPRILTQSKWQYVRIRINSVGVHHNPATGALGSVRFIRSAPTPVDLRWNYLPNPCGHICKGNHACYI